MTRHSSQIGSPDRTRPDGTRAAGRRQSLAAAALVVALGCQGTRPADVGEVAGALRACPPSPNCVSSDASDADHRVAPIAVVGPPERAFEEARRVVAGWPRTEIVRAEPVYLYAECRSAVLRFVDDLELVLRAERGEIAVRSASRVGYSDLGVNRRRVERLRDALVAAGVAAPVASDRR
jgi:uncharacterized protein (DUF1499 family)